MSSNHLGRAREIAQERISRKGLVSMHDFLAGMACGVEDTYAAVGALVELGELMEIPQCVRLPAERSFIRALGTPVPPDP